jgi:nitrate reductase NapE
MESSKKAELKAFLFITVFLFPIVTTVLIGGYGFIVWMLQVIFGPPGYNG